MISFTNLLSQDFANYDDNQGDLEIRSVVVLPKFESYSDTIDYMLLMYIKESLLEKADNRIKFYTRYEIKEGICKEIDTLRISNDILKKCDSLLFKAKGLNKSFSRFFPPKKEDFDSLIYGEIGRILGVDAVFVGTLYDYKLGETTGSLLFNALSYEPSAPVLKAKGWLSFALINSKLSKIIWFGQGKNKETESMSLTGFSFGTVTYQGYYPPASLVIAGAFDEISEQFPFQQKNLNPDELVLIDLYNNNKNYFSLKLTQPDFDKAVSNKKDENGQTILHILADNGENEYIKQLLGLGSLINAKDNEGKTPLIHAIEHEKFATALILLEMGADINSRDILGKTPLMYAVKMKNFDFLKNFINYNPEINMKDEQLNTALMISIQANELNEVSNFLIKNNSDLAIRNCSGATPLILSSQFGTLEIGKTLVKNNSNIHDKDYMGMTPLHKASEYGHVAYVKYLVGLGANINETNFDGKTSLILAVEKGNYNVIDFLCEQQSININFQDKHYETSLFKATINDNFDIAQMLIEHNADPNLNSDMNYSPLLIACLNSNYKIIDLILNKNANPNTMSIDSLNPILVAAYNNNYEIVANLVEHGARLDMPYSECVTPLIFATSNSNKKLVDFMISKDVDPNPLGADDLTALMLALKNENYEIALSLINYSKSNLNLQNSDGQTALMIAAWNTRNLNLIKALVENGANVNLLDKNNLSALDYTKYCYYNNKDIIKYLKSNGALKGRKVKATIK